MTRSNFITHTRRAGWSLIEMLVVITIITILLAILINTASERKGPQQQTHMAVRAAFAAQDEYEIATQVVINHGTNGGINWGTRTKNAPGATGTGSPDNTIERLVSAAWELEASRLIITGAGVAKSLVDTDNDGFLELRDGWGEMLEYRAYNDIGGELYNAGFPQRGTSDKPDPFVASKGENGQWGSHTAQNVPDTNAADNIYSFNLQ